MNMSLTDLHRIARATMADCPPAADAVWLDCVYDALTATYTCQLTELDPRAALPLARLFFCLVAQWNALRVLALERGGQLAATDHDARSVAQWRTVLMSEAEVMNSLCAEWHGDA